jgi:hypothetical protein
MNLGLTEDIVGRSCWVHTRNSENFFQGYIQTVDGNIQNQYEIDLRLKTYNKLETSKILSFESPENKKNQSRRERIGIKCLKMQGFYNNIIPSTIVAGMTPTRITNSRYVSKDPFINSRFLELPETSLDIIEVFRDDTFTHRNSLSIAGSSFNTGSGDKFVYRFLSEFNIDLFGGGSISSMKKDVVPF